MSNQILALKFQRLASFLGIFVLLTVLERASAVSQNDTLDWNPPDRLVKDYPYYLVGYDRVGNPVWLVPFGKWDVKAITYEGGEALEEFEKYVTQMFQRFHNPEIFGRNGSKEFVVINNLDGYSYGQVFSIATLNEVLKLTQIMTDMDHLGRKIKVNYFINASWLFDTILNMAKPLVGDLFDYAEIYQAYPDEWLQALLKEIPRDQIPTSLGGNNIHEYINVYG